MGININTNLKFILKKLHIKEALIKKALFLKRFAGPNNI